MSVKRYSIAEAKDQLPRLVHQVERGGPVELTRRGKPVAVLLSAADYASLPSSRVSFRDALDSFLESWPAAGDGITDELERGVRAKTPGRDFSW